MTLPIPTTLSPYLTPATASHSRFYPRGPFISITLAQLILESDWGRHLSGRNNYFGIKATAAQIAAGHATARWTHETIGGIYRKVIDYFADYVTPDDCFDAHATLLTTPWYHRCISAATPDAYAHALLLSHYATGIPGHPYDLALIDLMGQYNLYQFDRKG